MSKASIKKRLSTHSRSKKKKDLWTHFSIFDFNKNIYDDEIKELEGLFIEIYRRDKRANAINSHRFKAIKKLKKNIKKWKER